MSLCSRFEYAFSVCGCDVVVSTGGVSMGAEVDLVKSALVERLGATLHFGQLRMKPGKPTALFTLSVSSCSYLK